MTAESGEVLSSLTDGAAVDPDRLEAALGEPGAAALLVEFARLRATVESVNRQPGEAFYRAMHRHLLAPSPRLSKTRWAQFAAAVLVASALAAGLLVGRATAPFIQAAPELMAYCADAGGTLYAPGRIMLIDNRPVACVIKGEWQPLAR